MYITLAYISSQEFCNSVHQTLDSFAGVLPASNDLTKKSTDTSPGPEPNLASSAMFKIIFSASVKFQPGSNHILMSKDAHSSLGIILSPVPP